MTVSALYTIGHSTRPIADFIAILRAHAIEQLVDVRAYPGSRRFPQFNQAALARSLEEANIPYHHMPELGGRRTPRPDSRNTAWEEEAFRGFADYMDTREFATALADLTARATTARTAIMCSEKSWRHCHRGLIADAFKVAGVPVLHIETTGAMEEHPFTLQARVVEGRVSYACKDLFAP